VSLKETDKIYYCEEGTWRFVQKTKNLSKLPNQKKLAHLIYCVKKGTAFYKNKICVL